LSAVALVVLCGVGVGSATTRTRVERARVSPWDAAVEARQRFETKPAGTHSKVEYTQVMDEFRAIYHADPQDAHAARSVEQVAELLAEQGRELGDTKSLRDAAGQYEFLAKAYPGGTMAPRALEQALELLGPDAADDAAEARKVKTELELVYPKYARSVKAGPAVSKGDVASAGERRSFATANNAHLIDDKAVAKMGHPDVVAHKNPDAGRSVVVEETEPVRVAPRMREEAAKGRVIPEVPEREQTGPLAVVTGIRHWSTSSYTRVAIDLNVDPSEDVKYEAARVENPDRIFFDLHHARLAPQLAGKSFTVTDDGFLTKVRAAQFSDEVTRVVLDVHEVTEYSAFLLPNPYRLIIDIHGKAGAPTREDAAADRAQAAASVAAKVSAVDVAAVSAPAMVSAHVTRPSAGGVVAMSSLPPMPVTDGSASFGLPAKSLGAARTERVVAPQRVVISSKPTASKPVPNTVTKSSNDTGTEVAAVSEQPGKVEATHSPTSKPIAEKSNDDPASGDHYVPRSRRRATAASAADMSAVASAAVSAAPAQAALPTADGETSLMRTLGLKIGRIVIDAGHGGHDSGTLGVGGIEEKDVVLDVALRLGKLLHDRLGAEIVYTRADDTFIPLETRTAIANKAQADLFISVHANSSPDESARGVEVYYLNFTSDPEAMRVASRENAVSTQSVHELSDLVKKIALKDKIEESKELASDVDASLYAGLRKGNEGLKDRGVKKAPFVVLIGANMPSILAEISFVTNPDDAEKLQTPEYRERVAESLYKGVARYAVGINGVKSKVRTTEQAER
jgi:N-acetylmuramoyl-L-alanine amidase